MMAYHFTADRAKEIRDWSKSAPPPPKRILFARFMPNWWPFPGFFMGAEWCLARYNKNVNPWMFSVFGVNKVRRTGPCSLYNVHYDYPYDRPMEGAWEFDDSCMNRHAKPKRPDLSGYSLSLEDARADHPEWVRFVIDKCLEFNIIPDLMCCGAPAGTPHDKRGWPFDYGWWRGWWSTPCRDGKAIPLFYFMEQAEDRGLKVAVSPISGDGKQIWKEILDRGYTNWLEIDGRPVTCCQNFGKGTRNAIESFLGRRLFVHGCPADESQDLKDIGIYTNAQSSIFWDEGKYKRLIADYSATGKPWCPFFMPSCSTEWLAGVCYPWDEARWRRLWGYAKSYSQNLPAAWGIDHIGFIYENNWCENSPWMPTLEDGDAILRSAKEEMDSW